jgi:hypothetical protein
VRLDNVRLVNDHGCQRAGVGEALQKRHSRVADVLVLQREHAVPQAGQAATPLRDWPPVFGARVIAEPQPPARAAPEPEPQPPRPPAPPLESLGYSLKGIVSDGANRWALVSHPTGEQLLKVGDMLSDQYTISAIDVQGVWVQSDPGADPQLLSFAK